jgi:hypothetical protein
VKLPIDVLTELETALEGLRFARVNLEIVIHDQKPKFRIIVERSIVPGSETSGERQDNA